MSITLLKGKLRRRVNYSVLKLHKGVDYTQVLIIKYGKLRASVNDTIG